ncbi:uncharacterized protein [Dermacentor albipictus]|uniref:uncharacterized protein n=1 Tax=Dermacentor albipictus TaxID=60249 RepID=UPI0031FD325F
MSVLNRVRSRHLVGLRTSNCELQAVMKAGYILPEWEAVLTCVAVVWAIDQTAANCVDDSLCSLSCVERHMHDARYFGVAGHCENGSCVCTYLDPCEPKRCVEDCKKKHPEQLHLKAECKDKGTCKCTWNYKCEEAWCDAECRRKHAGKQHLHSTCEGYKCMCRWQADSASNSGVGRGANETVPGPDTIHGAQNGTDEHSGARNAVGRPSSAVP